MGGGIRPVEVGGEVADSPAHRPLASLRFVSPDYFATMGIPLRAGRDISAHDTPSGDPVMLVNETMARTLWPGQDPIGKFVLGPCAKERRVVGVVGDVRHLALEQASGNEMYIPLRQCGDLPSADLVVRSSLPPEHMANAVRAALRPIAPNLPGNFRSLQQLVDKSVSPRSFLVLLLGHVLVSLPYVVLVVQARLVGIRRVYEDAAMSLGANPLERLLDRAQVAHSVIDDRDALCHLYPV